MYTHFLSVYPNNVFSFWAWHFLSFFRVHWHQRKKKSKKTAQSLSILRFPSKRLDANLTKHQQFLSQRKSSTVQERLWRVATGPFGFQHKQEICVRKADTFELFSWITCISMIHLFLRWTIFPICTWILTLNKEVESICQSQILQVSLFKRWIWCVTFIMDTLQVWETEC